jgi:hypothetical protein
MQRTDLPGSPRGTIAYASGWKMGLGGRQYRRIVSLTPEVQTSALLNRPIRVWVLIVTDHTAPDHKHYAPDVNVITEATLYTVPGALAALGDAMRAAVDAGYAIKADLERVPRPLQ